MNHPEKTEQEELARHRVKIQREYGMDVTPLNMFNYLLGEFVKLSQTQDKLTRLLDDVILALSTDPSPEEVPSPVLLPPLELPTSGAEDVSPPA